MGKEEQKQQKAVAEAGAAVVARQDELSCLDEQHMALQNEWVSLESSAAEARTTLQEFESEVQVVLKEIEQRRADLHNATTVFAQFATLKNPLPIAPPDAEVEAPCASSDLNTETKAPMVLPLSDPFAAGA